MLKKLGAVCLAAALLLTGCTLRPQENGNAVQSISRPAVESAELHYMMSSLMLGEWFE